MSHKKYNPASSSEDKVVKGIACSVKLRPCFVLHPTKPHICTYFTRVWGHPDYSLPWSWKGLTINHAINLLSRHAARKHELQDSAEGLMQVITNILSCQWVFWNYSKIGIAASSVHVYPSLALTWSPSLWFLIFSKIRLGCNVDFLIYNAYTYETCIHRLYDNLYDPTMLPQALRIWEL